MIQNYSHNYTPNGFYNRPQSYQQQFRQPYPQAYNQSFQPPLPPPLPPPMQKPLNPPETLDDKITVLTEQVKKVSNLLEDILEYNKILTNRINKMFLYTETEAKAQCALLYKWIQRKCFCYLITINKNLLEWSCATCYPIYIEIYKRTKVGNGSKLLCIDSGFICPEIEHHLDVTCSDKELYRFKFQRGKKYILYDTADEAAKKCNCNIDASNYNKNLKQNGQNGAENDEAGDAEEDENEDGKEGESGGGESDGGGGTEDKCKDSRKLYIEGFIDIVDLNVNMKINKIKYCCNIECNPRLKELLEDCMSECNATDNQCDRCGEDMVLDD